MILDQEKIARIKKILKFKPRGMSISEIAGQLKMNRNSVAKYLEILLMNGEVEAKKLGTSKVYTVSQRVPVSGWIGFSSDMIIIINLSGQVLQANDAFLKFCNKTSEEITGISIKDIDNPLLYDIPLDTFLKDSHEKKTEYFEISLERSGCDYYFRGKLVPIIFDGGDEGILIIFEDISDRKHAEIALAERELQYRTVLENIQDVYYRSDKDGNLIMASPSWATVLGYGSLDECLGKNIAGVFYWDPEQRKPFLDTVYARGHVEDYEVTLKTKDGRRFYVATNSHLYFDNAGNILGVEGIFRDINERHASEEKIRNYISQIEFFSHKLQDFIELPPDADIFKKIANDIKDLLPDACILVSSYDDRGKMTVQSVAEDYKSDQITAKTAGKDLSGFAIQIDTLDYSSLKTGKIFILSQPLHETFLGEIVDKVRTEFFQDSEIGNIYAIGLVCEESLLGSVVIFLQSDMACKDTTMIETYIHQASITLKRSIAEHSLKKSEELFSNIAQNSPLAIAIINPDGTYIYINRNFTQMFGFDLRDFQTGREWFLLAYPDPDYRREVISKWKSDLERAGTGDQRPCTYKVRCKNGGEKDIYFMPVTLSDGKQCVVYEDITERRESEKVKKLLSSIVKSSNDAIIGKKINGTIISWNSAAEKMYGYTSAEILGKNISLIVPYELRQELDTILNQISRGHGVTNFETRRLKKEGTGIDVSVTISPIIDDNGIVIGASTISHDISSRKSEQLLRESEDKYRILVDNIHIGIYRSTGDPKGRFIWGNTSLVSILGFPSLEKLQKIDVADIFVETEGRKKLLDELQSAGFVKNKEVTLRRHDGTTLDVSVTALAKIDRSGQIQHINGIVEDITAQKQVLSQLKVLQHELVEIIEFSPDPTFVIDNKHQVIAWNSAIEQMTGVNKNDILGHADFAHAFPFYGTSRMILIDLLDASDDEIKKYYPDIKREGSSLVTKIFVPSLYSGHGAYLWAKASPLHDQEGKRIGAIEIIRDISEVKELQELLKNAKDGFVSDTLRQISIPDTADPVYPVHDEIKNPSVLSLLYLSNALKFARDSISILDLSGRCIWVNDTFAGLVSLKKNETPLGKSFAQFIAPEDRKLALDSLIDVRKNGNKQISLSLLTSTGRVHAQASLSSIMDHEDTILGYMTIIHRTDENHEKQIPKNGYPERTKGVKRVI
jgi:PAS domain S-box-containing protein